ncbi:MAG: vanadium-dependent haloperoxidase [Verrucomicrobiaceae bacterium]|nr:vanadium-dependent haloperoxidase [Verrucomicrobiaceae bacterium]
MKLNIRTSFLAAAIVLAAIRPPVRADIVTDWNAQILSAVDSLGAQSPDAARDMALLHTAIYNSIESVTNNYQIYSYGSYTGPSGSVPAGLNTSAAATSAAYTVMQSLFPTLAGPGGVLETQFNAHINALGSSQAVTDGVAWGQTVANELLVWRAGDGAAGAQSPYNVSGLGHWQPTGALQPLYPSWGDVTPFAIASASSVLPTTPPGYDPNQTSTTTLPAVLNSASNATLTGYLTTTTYANDYNLVKSLGSQSSLTRTPDQTEIAYFWAGQTGTVTQPGMWNQIASDVAGAFNYTLEEDARLFATLNVALADASIASWKAMYQTDLWRPVTAIAFESDIFSPNLDNNPLTAGEAGWTPLIATPDTPEYLSSQAAFASAAATVLSQFFGNNVNFSAASDMFGDGSLILNRSFTSFSQAADEAGMSGIYGGNQFLSAVTDAQAVGATIGNDVFNNNFTPVPEPSGAILVAIAGFAILLRRRTW